MSISFPSTLFFIGNFVLVQPMHIAFDQPKTKLLNLKIDYGREMLYLRFHFIMVPFFSSSSSFFYVRLSDHPSVRTSNRPSDCTFPGTMWEKMIINAFLFKLFPSYFHLIFLLFLFSRVFPISLLLCYAIFPMLYGSIAKPTTPLLTLPTSQPSSTLPYV